MSSRRNTRSNRPPEKRSSPERPQVLSERTEERQKADGTVEVVRLSTVRRKKQRTTQVEEPGVLPPALAAYPAASSQQIAPTTPGAFLFQGFDMNFGLGDDDQGSSLAAAHGEVLLSPPVPSQQSAPVVHLTDDSDAGDDKQQYESSAPENDSDDDESDEDSDSNSSEESDSEPAPKKDAPVPIPVAVIKPEAVVRAKKGRLPLYDPAQELSPEDLKLQMYLVDKYPGLHRSVGTRWLFDEERKIKTPRGVVINPRLRQEMLVNPSVEEVGIFGKVRVETAKVINEGRIAHECGELVEDLYNSTWAKQNLGEDFQRDHTLFYQKEAVVFDCPHVVGLWLEHARTAGQYVGAGPLLPIIRSWSDSDRRQCIMGFSVSKTHPDVLPVVPNLHTVGKHISLTRPCQMSRIKELEPVDEFLKPKFNKFLPAGMEVGTLTHIIIPPNTGGGLPTLLCPDPFVLIAFGLEKEGSKNPPLRENETPTYWKPEWFEQKGKKKFKRGPASIHKLDLGRIYGFLPSIQDPQISSKMDTATQTRGPLYVCCAVIVRKPT